MKLLVQIDPSTTEPIGVWGPGPDGEIVSEFIVDQPSWDALAHAESLDPEVVTSWALFATFLPDGDDAYECYPVEVAPGTPLVRVLVDERRAWAGTTASPGSSKFDAAIRRRRFAADMEWLADNVLGYGASVEFDSPIATPSPHVARASHQGGALVVGVAADENTADVDALLATGLVLQQDRDLHLLLPDIPRFDGSAERIWEATACRVAWIDTPVRLWSYDEYLNVSPIQTPSRQAALEALRQNVPIPIEPHDLGVAAKWVEDLVVWADANNELRPAHRQAYRAWHVDGRKVLGLEVRGSKLRVSAGHGADNFTGTIDQALDEETVQAMEASIGSAVARRLDGTDDGQPESRLQSRLTDEPGAIGLAGRLLRELPVRRPGLPRWAFLDLVGVDSGGHVHLVETKVKRDWMLGLQALDYWLWAKANRGLLLSTLRDEGLTVNDNPKVFIDVVVGSAAGNATEVDLRLVLPQLEALSGKVAWRIGEITGWREGDTSVSWYRRGVDPLPHRRHLPARFMFRLQQHLLARTPSTEDGGRRLWIDPADWLTNEARPTYEALATAGKLHRMVGHVRSSQLFALNLFAGLDQTRLLRALRTVPGLADLTSCAPPVFEFEDELDLLSEATKKSPHRTQVDVLLDCQSGAGERVAVLVEVKLSEDGFGACSAATAKGNDRLDLCATAQPFGGNTDGCFQLRNKANGDRRTYGLHLGDLTKVEEYSRHGCPFRYNNQPMRNMALAGSLVDRGLFDRAVFVTCAHDDHAVIWRRHDEATAQTPRHESVEVSALPASVMIAAHRADNRVTLAERYDLVGAVTSALPLVDVNDEGGLEFPEYVRFPEDCPDPDEFPVVVHIGWSHGYGMTKRPTLLAAVMRTGNGEPVWVDGFPLDDDPRTAAAAWEYYEEQYGMTLSRAQTTVHVRDESQAPGTVQLIIDRFQNSFDASP